jgi:hypothetical protein
MSVTVEPIVIWGHEDEPSSDGQGGGTHKFEAEIQPRDLKTRRSVLFNTNNRANGGYDVAQYQGHGRIELDITLRITKKKDEDDDVHVQIDKLLKATYDYMGGSHKSPYVTIKWGQFKFLGHLKDMAIDYQAFNPDGTAKFAVVDMTFISHVNSLANAHTQNRNSPDMSHMKLIKEGDKIPLICDDIYDDPTYYIQIANVNNLTNFRKITPGKKIVFPPLIN